MVLLNTQLSLVGLVEANQMRDGKENLRDRRSSVCQYTNASKNITSLENHRLSILARVYTFHKVKKGDEFQKEVPHTFE